MNVYDLISLKCRLQDRTTKTPHTVTSTRLMRSVVTATLRWCCRTDNGDCFAWFCWTESPLPEVLSLSDASSTFSGSVKQMDTPADRRQHHVVTHDVINAFRLVGTRTDGVSSSDVRQYLVTKQRWAALSSSQLYFILQLQPPRSWHVGAGAGPSRRGHAWVRPVTRHEQEGGVHSGHDQGEKAAPWKEAHVSEMFVLY